VTTIAQDEKTDAMQRVRFFILFTTFALVAASAACAKGAEKNPAAAAPAARPLEAMPPPAQCTKEGAPIPQKGLRTAAVVVEAESGEQRFSVELCETSTQRNFGMMCRDYLAADKGMLFLFERMAPRSFWMKNTLIALDMVFIDDEGRVVGVVENAEPLTLDSRSPGAPAQYVLEVRGGTAARLGIRAGQWVRFEGIDGHPAARPSSATSNAGK